MPVSMSYYPSNLFSGSLPPPPRYRSQGQVADFIQDLFRDHPTISAIYSFTQLIPVVGAVAAVPLALFSAVMVIIKITQAIFQKIKDGTPFFRSTDDSRYFTPLVEAASYAMLFADSILNICTLGLLNNVMIWIGMYKRTRQAPPPPTQPE